jgi:serine protease Do
MKKLMLLILFSFLCMLAGCGLGNLFTDDEIEIDTLNHISMVVVNSNIKIKTTTSEIITHQPGPYEGSGSGVVFHKTNYTYYVLTNNHVITLTENNRYRHIYTVEDNNNNTYDASLVTAFTECDLAILQFETLNQLGVIELSVANPKVGEIVFSIGSPFGQHNIITAGKVLDYREIDNVDYEVIIHNAIIRNGSSGSMLINENFEIVGINTWGFKSNKDDEEDFVVGGATPVEKILECLHNYPLFKNI